MFNQAIIHYPTDENVLKQIGKDIAAFRCDAVAKYIETLKMNYPAAETAGYQSP